MTGILSTISGQFSKSLILGAFFPAALFMAFWQVLFVPLASPDWSFLRPLEALDPSWRVVGITLMALLLTGLLYNLNTPIIRFYEGYPWRHSRLGGWLSRRHQARYRDIDARWRGMSPLAEELSGSRRKHAQIQDWQAALGRRLRSEFPHREDLVLPTQLGNIIRSFESYPYLQYGMSAIPLWPRLVAKVDKEYAASISEAKTSLDFMINLSALSGVLGVAILCAGLWSPASLTVPELLLRWVLGSIGALGFAVLAYYWAIGRAADWGTMVKGAFDLYRWDLLEQLHYEGSPGDRKAERDLWRAISRQIVFVDPPGIPQLKYTPRPTAAGSAEPAPAPGNGGAGNRWSALILGGAFLAGALTVPLLRSLIGQGRPVSAGERERVES